MADGNRIDVEDGIIMVVIDQNDCSGIWRDIESHIAAGNKQVVLDFCQVTYLNSMNIAGIISLRNKVEEAGGKLALADLKDQISAIFRILKLERIFNLEMDKDQARLMVKA